MAEPRDEELQNYLDGRSRLSARYRWASRETTTPELDAAVLDYARAQAKAAPSPPQRRRSRWFVPLATAATLVMGVDLVWHLRHWATPQMPTRAEGAKKAEAVETGETTVAAAPQTSSAPSAAPQLAEPSAAEADAAATRQPPAAGPAPSREAQARAEKSAPAPVMQAPPPEESAGPASTADVLVAAPDDAESLSFADEQEDAERDAITDEQAAMRERRQAPAANLLAAPEVAPQESAPALAVDEDAVAEQARSLAQLLRDEDFAAVKEHYAVPTFPRQALQAASDVLRAHVDDGSQRLSEEGGHRWRIDYLDANDQVRCTARVQRTEDGWQLLELITRP